MAEAPANTMLIHTGVLPPTLGSFVTIINPSHGKSLRKRCKFLGKVHIDIVFGDCIAFFGGGCYALLLVDVATQYYWMYDMTGINSSDIIGALVEFQVDDGGLSKQFHTNFDCRLIGGKALKWILTNKSNDITTSAGCQYI